MALDALNASVAEIDEAVNTQETKQINRTSAADTCNNLSAAEAEILSVCTLNRSDEFGREVWGIDQLDAALALSGYSLRQRSFLNVTGARNIRLARDITRALLFEASGVKAADFMGCSLLTAIGQFDRLQNDSP